MAKIKKTFRLTPEAAVKVESAENETEFVEKAILQYNIEKIIEKIPELPKAEIVRVYK